MRCRRVVAPTASTILNFCYIASIYKTCLCYRAALWDLPALVGSRLLPKPYMVHSLRYLHNLQVRQFHRSLCGLGHRADFWEPHTPAMQADSRSMSSREGPPQCRGRSTG